jgi:hypothetical protein
MKVRHHDDGVAEGDTRAGASSIVGGAAANRVSGASMTRDMLLLLDRENHPRVEDHNIHRKYRPGLLKRKTNYFYHFDE